MNLLSTLLQLHSNFFNSSVVSACLCLVAVDRLTGKPNSMYDAIERRERDGDSKLLTLIK